MGKLKDAEEYFQRNKERYDTWEEASMFYMRHRNDDAHCGKEADKFLKEKFPDGMVKLEASALVGPPKVGVKMTSVSPRTEQYKLKIGDIFVGVDGYRVQTQDQFYVVRALKKDPAIEFTVWDGAKYRVISASFPDRRFHCKLEDYKDSQ